MLRNTNLTPVINKQAYYNELKNYVDSAVEESTRGIVITSQPTDQTASVGETATFSVTAEGSNLVYYWLWWSNGNGRWQEISTSSAAYSGQRTSTMTVEGANARNGHRYMCIVSNGSTAAITTPVVTLHIA